MEITEKEMNEISKAQRAVIKSCVTNMITNLICAKILRKSIDMISFEESRIGSSDISTSIYNTIDIDGVDDIVKEIYIIANNYANTIAAKSVDKIL